MCHSFMKSLDKNRVVDDTPIVSFTLWTPDKSNWCKSIVSGDQNQSFAKANVFRQV